MTISNTSRSLLESGKRVITTIRSYGVELMEKADHANLITDVIIVGNKQEDANNAAS